MTLRTALIAAALGLLTACQSTTVAAPGADVTRTSTRNPDVVVPASPAIPVAYSGSAEGGAALNAYRRQQGLPPLREHPALNRAAYDQASWMHQSGAQTHAGRSGSTVASRLRSAGCSYRWAAENIAWGHRSDSSAMQWWMNSPSHRANSLNNRAGYYGWATVGTQRALVLASGC